MIEPRFKVRCENSRFKEEQYICVQYEGKYFPLYERVCVTLLDGVQVVGDLYWVYDECLDLLVEDLRIRISYIQIKSISKVQELR